VAVGTESFRDPAAGDRVRRELAALLGDHRRDTARTLSHDSVAAAKAAQLQAKR
jgi:hypothetical protein